MMTILVYCVILVHMVKMTYGLSLREYVAVATHFENGSWFPLTVNNVFRTLVFIHLSYKIF